MQGTFPGRCPPGATQPSPRLRPGTAAAPRCPGCRAAGCSGLGDMAMGMGCIPGRNPPHSLTVVPGRGVQGTRHGGGRDW